MRIARTTRDAGVELFVFSARNAPDGLEPFVRYGNDIVFVWDAEDPRSDVVLVAGLSVTRALCARERARSDAEAADFDAIERAILEIEKQARGFDEVTRSAETIKSGSERILKRAEIVRKAFGDQIETLTEKVRDLQRLIAEPGTEWLRGGGHVYGSPPVGESGANPNRPTWQQRQTPTEASSKPETRSLRFGFAPAQRTPEQGTEWRCGQSGANWSLESESLIYRETTGKFSDVRLPCWN